MFSLMTLLSLITLILGLSFHRLRVTQHEGSFFGWLKQRSTLFFKEPFPGRRLEPIKALLFWRFPVIEKWGLICFVGSFSYLAVSGFGYALFSRHGLHGYPLLLHICSGGLYAVSLSYIVLLRSNTFTLDVKPLSSNRDPARLRNPSLSLVSIQKILFWLFVLCGLFLIISALTSMLRLLFFSGQKTMFEVHRYSALISLLIAIIFSYFILLDQSRR